MQVGWQIKCARVPKDRRLCAVTHTVGGLVDLIKHQAYTVVCTVAYAGGVADTVSGWTQCRESGAHNIVFITVAHKRGRS